MKRGVDIAAEFHGVTLIHQNLPGRSVATHVHEEHHLFLPLQGDVTLSFEDLCWTFGPQQMVYLPSRVAHAFASEGNEDGERLIAMFSDAAWRRLGGRDGLRAALLPCSQLLKETFFYLLLNRSTQASAGLVSSLVRILDEQMAVAGSGDVGVIAQLVKAGKDSRLRKACDILAERFCDEIDIVNLAETVETSVRTLNRLFQKELGVSPKQLLTHLRIAEARRLLAETRLSVTDVAFETGYSSLSHFIESFRAVTGCLPSDFRRFGRKP